MDLARCVNGRQDESWAHEFDGYGGPIPERPDIQPVIYCRRCGEVRPMRPAIEELSADERRITSAVISGEAGNRPPPPPPPDRG